MEVGRILFTVDVQYTGSIEHAHASSGSSTEQPSCQFVLVCTEVHKMDLCENVNCIFTFFFFPCVFNM